MTTEKRIEIVTKQWAPIEWMQHQLYRIAFNWIRYEGRVLKARGLQEYAKHPGNWKSHEAIMLFIRRELPDVEPYFGDMPF